MALIRQANAKAMARDAIVLDLGDLAAQGELLKARARAEADQIVAESRAERKRLLDGAAEEGRREGLARGLEEGRKQGADAGKKEAIAAQRETLSKLESAWGAALAAFESSRDQMLLEAKEDIVKLAAIVAELVTKRAMVLEPSRVADQLGAVLGLLSRATRLVVSVHPDDESILREALPALAATLPAATHVEFATDPALERGSCVARSGSGGVIDASIRTQLQRISETLVPNPAPVPEAPSGAGEAP